MADRVTRVLLEFDPELRPIQGTIAVDGAPACDFAGWMELVEMIETVLGPPRLEACGDAAAEPSTSGPAGPLS